MSLSRKILTSLFVITCLCIILACLNKCNGKPVITPIDKIRDSLKVEIRKELKNKDSIKKVVVYRDSIRTRVVWKYRTDKGLDLPCDTILKLVIANCDTIISVDSTLIVSLKDEILVDSIIIDSQLKVIKLDSIDIASLQKKLKRRGLREKLIAGGLGGLLLISLLR